ncbi:Non-specific serine/threonine protein kinase [Blyttiomyces sp. JEL0837]|nr:Non-specific serine/threonine protein kinase [Blyttiomyces sp. JEL0837]
MTANVTRQDREISNCFPIASKHSKTAARSNGGDTHKMGKRELRVKLEEAQLESAALRKQIQRTMAALRVQEKRCDAKISDINRLCRDCKKLQSRRDLASNLRQSQENKIYLEQQVEFLSAQIQAYETFDERIKSRRDLASNLRQSQENEIYLKQQVEFLSAQLQAYQEAYACLEVTKEQAVNEEWEKFKTMQEQLLSENKALKASLTTVNDSMGFLSKRADSLEMELAAMKKASKISVNEKESNGNDPAEGAYVSDRSSQVARIGLGEWPSQETLTSSIRASVLSTSVALATNNQTPRASIDRPIKTQTNVGGQKLGAVLPVKWNLRDLLCTKHIMISELGVKFYISELVVLLEGIRSSGGTYGRLEPLNVIIEMDGHISLSADIKPTPPSWCGGQLTAVQMLQQKQPDRICDLWGLGVLAYAIFLTIDRSFSSKILTGELPFGVKWQDKPFDVIKKISINKLPFPETVSKEAQTLIRRLLHRDQHQRLGTRDMAHIKRHEFFKGADWDKIARKKVQPPFVPAAVDIDQQEG